MWRKAGKTADFHGCEHCNILIRTIDNGTFGQFRLSWVLKGYGKNKP